MARKIVIAGGPHTGKTTLLNRLEVEFAGSNTVHFVPEPAGTIIDEELRRRQEQPGYVPIMPTTHYRDFAGLVVPRSVELEEAIPGTAQVAFLDRSLVDNIAYARMNKCGDLIPSIQAAARAACYSTVLFCEPVGEYAQTNVRLEDQKTAMVIHEELAAAYAEQDITIVQMPPVGVDERLALVQGVLYS